MNTENDLSHLNFLNEKPQTSTCSHRPLQKDESVHLCEKVGFWGVCLMLPWYIIHVEGFPGGSEVKVSAFNMGDLGSIPGSGRSPGEGNGNPLQYSCLENPMDRGAWWATVHGGRTGKMPREYHSQMGRIKPIEGKGLAQGSTANQWLRTWA